MLNMGDSGLDGVGGGADTKPSAFMELQSSQGGMGPGGMGAPHPHNPYSRYAPQPQDSVYSSPMGQGRGPPLGYPFMPPMSHGYQAPASHFNMAPYQSAPTPPSRDSDYTRKCTPLNLIKRYCNTTQSHHIDVRWSTNQQLSWGQIQSSPSYCLHLLKSQPT